VIIHTFLHEEHGLEERAEAGPLERGSMPTPCVGVKELSAIVDSLSAARLADADRLDDAAQRIEHLEAQLLERDSQQSQQVAEAKKLRDELVGYRASSASLETLERDHKQLLQEHHALKAALERLLHHGTPLTSGLAVLTRLHDARMAPHLVSQLHVPSVTTSPSAKQASDAAAATSAAHAIAQANLSTVLKGYTEASERLEIMAVAVKQLAEPLRAWTQAMSDARTLVKGSNDDDQEVPLPLAAEDETQPVKTAVQHALVHSRTTERVEEPHREPTTRSGEEARKQRDASSRARHGAKHVTFDLPPPVARVTSDHNGGGSMAANATVAPAVVGGIATARPSGSALDHPRDRGVPPPRPPPLSLHPLHRAQSQG